MISKQWKENASQMEGHLRVGIKEDKEYFWLKEDRRTFQTKETACKDIHQWERQEWYLKN